MTSFVLFCFCFLLWGRRTWFIWKSFCHWGWPHITPVPFCKSHVLCCFLSPWQGSSHEGSFYWSPNIPAVGDAPCMAYIWSKGSKFGECGLCSEQPTPTRAFSEKLLTTATCLPGLHLHVPKSPGDTCQALEVVSLELQSFVLGLKRSTP
jgi:hypothetical protein